MKNLKNYVIAVLIGFGSFGIFGRSYGQDDAKFTFGIDEKGAYIGAKMSMKDMIRLHPLAKDTIVGDKHLYNISLPFPKEDSISVYYSLSLNKDNTIDELACTAETPKYGDTTKFFFKDKGLDGEIDYYSIIINNFELMKLESPNEIKNSE